MKLYIKRDSSACNRAFLVYDELGCEKYTVCTAKENNTHKFLIKNNDGFAVAKISRVSFSNLLAYNVKAEGKAVRVIMGISKGELSGSCYGNNWKICGSAVSKCFAITDVDNTVIAAQKKAFLKNDTYEFEVFKDSNELLSLGAAVCINMLNTVDNPVTQAV